MTIEVGQQVPDIELLGDNGEKVKLSDFKGKHIVLYFYPKDMTPGCTTEACDFRDRHQSFAELDAVIIGVSPDGQDKHQKFKEKHDLPFLLLVDDEQKLSEAFGVWKLKRTLVRNTWELNAQRFLLIKKESL